MKMRVYAQFTVSGYVDVDVSEDSECPEDDAMDLAEKRFGKAATFAGGGSICGLAGFTGNGIGLDVSEMEMTDVDPL